MKRGDIFWSEGSVRREDRERANGHRALVLWLTGLSAAGKTTLARGVEEALFARGCRAYVLDGDNIRHGLNADLGFSPEHRTENIRRIGEVARLFVDAGVVAITAFISPYREDRDAVRARCAPREFVEVFVSCELGVCAERDPKGLYEKAMRGDIPQFTGVSAPYEAPASPELVVRTDRHSPEECVRQVIAYLEAEGYLPAPPLELRGASGAGS